MLAWTAGIGHHRAMMIPFPPAGSHARPRQDLARIGFDPGKLAAAAAFALEIETPWPRDLRAHLEAGYFEAPPDNAILGPIAPRGGPNGLVLRDGDVVVSWGDTRQSDFTFSAAKSYLSLLAGIAFDDGLISDLDEPVSATVTDGGFASAHNAIITWRHLLTNTSEWEGTLFGKADTIDRNRSLATEGRGKRGSRVLQAPGTYWEYNDVRVNRLSLALLRLFGRALPEVFAERIMEPIGASHDWSWHGYSTSVVDVGGKQIESVSGGTHWGGGMRIHAEDMARIGLLMAARGAWGGRQLVSEHWVELSLAPCSLNHSYGFLWWLNTHRARLPAAPASSFFAVGAGGNMIWIDPEHGVVAVMRWMDPAAQNDFIAQVLGAIR
jgi:CubicO group peptidase (beta-lactamase class C family)